MLNAVEIIYEMFTNLSLWFYAIENVQNITFAIF